MHLEVWLLIASCHKPMDTKQNSGLKERFFFSHFREQSINMSFPDQDIQCLFRRNELKNAIKRHKMDFYFLLVLAPRFHVSLCAPNFF